MPLLPLRNRAAGTTRATEVFSAHGSGTFELSETSERQVCSAGLSARPRPDPVAAPGG
jgi:hypothetical protein